MLASQLRSAKADDIGEIAVSGIRINQLSRQRVTTFLNHLATELERLEVALSVEHQNIVANLGPDAIGFTIKEAKQKEKHVPTDAELEKKRKHGLRRQNDWDHLFPQQFWPEYDYFHIGNLSFEIDNYAGGARKRWTDAKTQRLEGLLNVSVRRRHFRMWGLYDALHLIGDDAVDHFGIALCVNEELAETAVPRPNVGK